MNIKRRLTSAAAVLLACIAALVFAALVPARAIPPSGGRQYRGIDISEIQGEIDFEEVRRSGIEAVYIRVGAGEYTDEYFAENYERAKAAGLKIGFYHYVTASSVDEGRRQARFFASLAAGREPDMRLAMDFEYFGSLSVSQINAISEAYLDELTALTRREANLCPRANTDAHGICPRRRHSLGDSEGIRHDSRGDSPREQDS